MAKLRELLPLIAKVVRSEILQSYDEDSIVTMLQCFVSILSDNKASIASLAAEGFFDSILSKFDFLCLVVLQ